MAFATGAMGTLLPKLGELLQEEYKLQKSVKKGVRDLEHELICMQAALEKISNVPLDQLDLQVKIWANDIRELSYDIEDSLDSFMVRVEGLEPSKSHDFMDFIKKAGNKITKFKCRHEIANNIKDIKIKVKEVKERYDRYKVNDIVRNISATTIDPRLSALYSNVSDLVGIDIAIDELTKKVSQDTDVSVTKLNAISVVGFGGLGKTTLTKAVYDKLAKKFDCAGFVSVGQNPDIQNVFQSILHELDKHKYMYICAAKWNVTQLINEVREFLSTKRYLIVIDDLWDRPTWDKIQYALVDNNHGSRIIITTRIREVARRVGGIYDMRPLSEDNSRKLFNNRIFGAEGVSPDNQPGEVPEKILKKCGGVPLSIVTIASLLVNKARDEWCKVYDSIGFGQEENDVVQNTRKILAFSYYDLPSHLKTCLLYMAMFPEDWLIFKTDLIWRWVAEGIVSRNQVKGLLELGESYWNELINRSMIRLVEPFRSAPLGCCRVHDMVLDLIRALSAEINFVTVQDNREHLGTSLPSRKNNVRRLAMQKTSMEHNDGMEKGHIRSYNAFMCSGDRMLSLRSFKVLHVLDLENCDFSAGGCHLEHLGKLVQLRYLCLLNTNVSELPKEIGLLKLLQALVVFKCGIKELPRCVSELSNLACLFLSDETRMMSEVGQLICLEELRLYCAVEQSPNFVKQLKNLTELRELHIKFEGMNEIVQKDLVESLRNLRKIRIITTAVEKKGQMEIPCLDIWEVWAPPSTLHMLKLDGITLSRLPSWIDPSCVPHLSLLSIRLEVLEARDMKILGRLPLLRHLILSASKEKCMSYTVPSREFNNLGDLATNIEVICGEGALPMLYNLRCYASVRKDVGLVGNVPLLQKVTYWLDCKGCVVEEVEEAEEALRQAAQAHPNQPTLAIKRTNYTEVSLADVRAVAAYLKDVLHVPEGVSASDEKDFEENSDEDSEDILDEEEPMAYLRRVLHASTENSDEVIMQAATKLKDVLCAPEEVWLTDAYVRLVAAYLKDVLPLPGKVSVADQEPSEVEAAEDCSGAPVSSDTDTDLNRLTLGNTETDSTGTSAEGRGLSQP